MRVLLINELYTMGGSEIQTLREKKVLREKGHDVWHLTFDKDVDYTIDPEDSQHINIAPIRCIGYIQRFKDKLYKWAVVDKTYKDVLIRQIDAINPDVIHLNVNNYKQITLYSALKKYNCIQTIRDFSAVCPSRVCVNRNYKACKGYCYGKCLKECMPQGSIRAKIRFSLLAWNIKKVNKYRLAAVNINLCPSQFLTDTCTQNGIPTKCLNNSFDFSILNGFEKHANLKHKVYVVYGIVAAHKGIRQIIEAFDIFAKGKDVELQIIGKVLDAYQDEFNQLLSGKENIHYLGQMKYAGIIKHLETVYAVVVPSLWLENYPNTALEGLATKCVVLGSNRGGIPELIRDKRFNFDVLDQSSIISSLESSYLLSEDEWKKLTETNCSYVKSNNSLDQYYERIISVFDNLNE